MYLLYQIGDVALFDALVGFNGDPVEAELEYGWENPSTRFEGIGSYQYHSPLTRSLPEEIEFSIKGQLKQLPYLNVSKMKSRIHAFAGRRNTPVIVISYEEGECVEIKWLIAYGMITEGANKHSYRGSETTGSLITQDLDLTIVFQEPFTQLSQWFWELRPNGERLYDPFSEEAAQAGLNGFWHPQTIAEVPEDYHFVRWQETATAYDPEFWGLNYINEMAFGGYSSDFIDAPLELYIHSSEDLWAQTPRCIYAFTNLSPLGTLSIETELKTGLYHNETLITVSELNLVQLDTDLAAVGYGGLHISDLVYSGATNPRPGFIQRDGVMLEGIRPRWSYEGSYPGEISNGASWIHFVPYLTDAQCAYNIQFKTI